MLSGYSSCKTIKVVMKVRMGTTLVKVKIKQGEVQQQCPQYLGEHLQHEKGQVVAQFVSSVLLIN